MLNLTEKQVMDLAENGSLPAYKVGGLYLRFKREQVEEIRKKSKQYLQPLQRYSLKDRILDFYYFNDFYIFSIVFILILLLVIVK